MLFVAKDLKKLPLVNFNHINVSSLLSQMNQMKYDIDSLKHGVDNMSKLYLTTSGDIRQIKEKILDLPLEKDMTVKSVTISTKSDHSEDSDMSVHSKSHLDDSVSVRDCVQPLVNTTSTNVCVNEEPDLQVNAEVPSACGHSVKTGENEIPDNDADGFTVVNYGRYRRRHRSYADAVADSQKKDDKLTNDRVGDRRSPATTTKELIRPADSGRSKFILGKRQHTGLQTAATQRKRVFVSRLRPETDTEHLVRYIRETMRIDTIDCDKLKTKYDSYASFCIAVRPDNFESLMNPDVWPEGVLIRKFYQPRKS
ncbi:uncharacterized protein [Ptychodera flava]|uniref:uncharacterized protein n=1 Tax=Ptychodera flava TaxID=63121 RepID=UPI003969DC65